MPYGDLDVYLEGALNIKDTSYIGKGSPYCILIVAKQIFKSDVAQEGGSKPYWNKTFSFKIDRGMDDLQIYIYNKNSLRDDDFLGESLISFAEVFRGGHEVPITSYKVNRSGKHYGEIRLGLTFYAKRRAQPQPQRSVGGGRQQPLYYKSQGLGTDTGSPRYNGLNRNVSFKTDDEYPSSNEGSGRRYSSGHGRNGSIGSRLSETTEGFIGGEDAQPANTIHEQKEYYEEGPTRAQSLPSAHHPNNRHQLHGSQSMPPHATHAQHPQRPHVEGPLWPPRGIQHEQHYYDEENHYKQQADDFKDLHARSESAGRGEEFLFPSPRQDRGNKPLSHPSSPGPTQDSSMSRRDGNEIHVAVPRRLSSFQDMESRADFSFAEVSTPSPKQGYPIGMSGPSDGIPTAIEMGSTLGSTLTLAGDEEEIQVEAATASLASIAKDEPRLNDVVMGSRMPDDDGPLYKSFRRRGQQATKKLPQVVESLQVSQSSKIEGELDDVESQSSHHSRKSSLSSGNLKATNRSIPHEQATRDAVDIDTDTFGEYLSPNGCVDQVPNSMGPRDFTTTQGYLEGRPQDLQITMHTPNVSIGGPNLGYGRGGLPQQGNGGPPFMRPNGRGRGRGVAAMIRPPLEHNYGMGVAHQGFVQNPPGNMLPNAMQSAQGPRPRPQRPLITNQQGPRLIRPQVQNPGGHPQPTGPMQMRMRPGARPQYQGPQPMFYESDPQPSQVGKSVGNQLLQATRGVVGVQESQDADSDVESCGSRKSTRSHVSKDSLRSTTSSGLARVGPPLRLKPNFGMQDASKEDGQRLGKYNLRVQVEVEGSGGGQETSSTQPHTFAKEDNPCTIDAHKLEDDAKVEGTEFEDPGPLEDKDTQALETLQDEGADCYEEIPGVQESIPQEQCFDTKLQSDVHFTMKETLVVEALHIAPSVTTQDMSSTEQGLDTSVSVDTHLEFERTVVMEASQVDHPEVALQDLPSIEQSICPNDDHNPNREVIEDAHVDFQETEDLKLSYEESFAPQGNFEHEDDTANVDEVDIGLPTEENNYDGTTMAPIDCEVYAQVVDVDEEASNGFEFSSGVVCNSELYMERQDGVYEDAHSQQYVNGDCDEDNAQRGSDSDSDGSSHDAKAQQHKERNKKDGAISHNYYRDLSPPKYTPRRSSQVASAQQANVHPYYAGAEQNDRVTSWLQESNGEDSIPPPYNTYEFQPPNPQQGGGGGGGRGRGQGRGPPNQQVARGRGPPPPSYNNPQFDEQSYHPDFDFQPTEGQYYELVDESMAYPQVQCNTQEGDVPSVSRAAVVQPTDGKSTMAKKMKGVMKNITSFGKATMPIWAPIGAAITGEVVKQTLALTSDDSSGQGGNQGIDGHIANMMINNATNMVVRAAVGPQQRPVGRGGPPMGGGMRGQAPMGPTPRGRGMAPPMRGEMPLGYGGMMRGGSTGGYPGAPQTGGYPRAPQTGGYPRAPQTGGPRAPQMGSYPRAPQMGGYPRAPQMGVYPRASQMGGQPRPPTYYQGEEY